MSEIKIITEPKVYVLARQEIDGSAFDAFMEDEEIDPPWEGDARSAAEHAAEVAGRLCYMSFKNPRPGGNKAYIDHIVESGHGRVLEHAVWTLLVTGISRSLAQELYTHTVGMSKSMLSQRFVDESDCAFVVPPALLDSVKAAQDHLEEHSDEGMFSGFGDGGIPDDVAAGIAWLDACQWAISSYRHLAQDHMGDPVKMNTARRKQVREAARSVLPNCVETKICLTGNARAFRHFLEMRGSAQADAEIRRLALALLAVLVVEAPVIFADYTLSLVDGVEVIQTPNRKV